MVLILDIIAIAFVATAAVLESGLDLTTMASCRAAVYACLAFYFTFKGAIQVFLVERLHVLRRTGQRRLEDRYWTGGSTMVFCGFGVIAVIAFLWPNAALSSSDGKCLIGLPNKVLIPLLTYDIFINVGLTTLFVLLLLPYLRLRDILLHQPSTKKQTVERAVVQRGNVNPVPANSGHAIEILTTTSVETWSENTRCSPKSATSSCQMVRTCPSCKRVKVRSNNLWKLVIRSLCGSVMVLVPTIINLVLIYCWRGKEQGWLCFTVCTLDGKFTYFHPIQTI